MVVSTKAFRAAIRSASSRCAVLPAKVSRASPTGFSVPSSSEACAPRFSTVAALASTSTTIQRPFLLEAMAATVRCSLGETS